MVANYMLGIQSEKFDASIDVREVCFFVREGNVVKLLFIGGGIYHFMLDDTDQAKAIHTLFSNMKAKLED